MFFKRLEITGFKSFAKKTVLEFLPGITVIVGPNGCGKSNIFDAVRWALGEQRSRTLRGQRMADVIFAGSANLKAQSMASVNLVVNNEDRRLPIDFSEVQVGRKLFKAGEDQFESEYLLNRRSCRLREVTDLFMDTGIGTNSYSVMEQGQVDFIINARPAERRYLFDEAVGISKYRARRDEAIRKLDRTETDLQRLHDLLGEIKSRLRSLKIQANRAERYKKMVGEVRALERDLMMIGYRAQIAEKKQVDARYDAVNSDLQAVVAQLAQLEQGLVDKQVELDQMDRDVEAVRTRRLEMTADLERAQSNQAVLRERISTTEAQMRRNESQIETLKRNSEILTARRDRIRSEGEELGEEMARLETEYEQRRRQFDELVRTQTNARQQLAELRERAREAIEERTRHESESRIASVMKQQSEENLFEARTKLGESRARVCATTHRVKQRQIERRTIAGSIAQLREEMEELEQIRRQQNEKIREREERRAGAMRERDEAASRLQALRLLQENNEGFVQGVREIMAASERSELSDVVGILANLIESQPENELAIETALAAHVQDVVVEQENAARNAIAFLRRRELGRATFLPLTGIAPAPRSEEVTSLVGREGVVGIAADLVRTEDRFRAVVESLLGGYVVVDNLETAQGLREQGIRVDFVTRGGSLLAASGALTGGHVRPSGLLAREREIRELGERTENLEREIGEVEQAIAQLAAESEASDIERERLSERLNSTRNSLAQLDSDIDRAADDRAEAQRLCEQAEREVERLLAKIEGYDQTLAEHARVLEASDARAGELRSQLEEVEATNQDRDQQASVLQEALAEVMARVSGARERLDSARGRVSELDEEIVRCQNDLQQQTEELESLSQALDRACAEIETSTRRYEELSAELQEVNREIEQWSNQREAKSEEIQQAQHEAHAQQRRRNELQNDLHEVDRQRAQCEFQIQNLQQQAAEKFKTTLEEVVSDEREIEKPREQLVEEIATLRGRIESMGEVNVIAIEEHRTLSERYEFLGKQRDDLEEAKTALRKTIRTIDATSTELFTKGMTEIRERFRETFRRLFGGGRADLVLSNPDDILNSGVDIVAQPPGKQLQNITLLSGGEKALTAISLLFGIFLFRPSPFCVLDEIDAPLDDANIERFKAMVTEFSRDVQFIIITHNKQTMALADTLYGVTMEESGVSRIVSVRFDQVEETALVG